MKLVHKGHYHNIMFSYIAVPLFVFRFEEICANERLIKRIIKEPPFIKCMVTFYHFLCVFITQSY